jgi:hypothetical protein
LRYSSGERQRKTLCEVEPGINAALAAMGISRGSISPGTAINLGYASCARQMSPVAAHLTGITRQEGFELTPSLAGLDGAALVTPARKRGGDPKKREKNPYFS